MSNIISGPGLGLPLPQALYPASLVDTAYTAPTSRLSLQGGQTFTIPAGTWAVAGGAHTAVQYLDPVTQQWTNLIGGTGAAWSDTVRSDGQNFRVANSSGVATGATVSAPGSGYVAGSTFVTPSAGNSVWQAIVGGSLGTATIVNGGANYSIPPLVFVPFPPPPGIPATGHAVLTAGAVTGIVWDNVGAGYTFAPSIVIVPSPNDPNYSSIQAASATVVLGGAGGVTAVILKNPGQPEATAITLAITGAGTGAAATVAPGTWVTAATDQVTVQPASGF
jgi:hypothetical protein